MRSLCFTFLCLLLGLGACKEAGSPAGPTSPGAAEGTSSCTALSDRLCEAAGRGSATCASFESTLEVLSDEACAVAMRDIEGSLKKLKEQRAPCDELVAKLCADLGPDTSTCKMVKERTPAFPVQQCTAMLGQYNNVLADLKRQEAANRPLDAEQQKKIAAGDVPAFGPQDAKVTIVEFSDFQCPYCSMAANVANELKQKYGEKVRFIFRQFPLEMHPDAHLAAQASLAAEAQGKFWPYHDKLFANQRNLSRADLEKYAQEVGLDMAKFKKALDEGTYKDEVDRDFQLGQEVGVQGTPTMFINGERVGNPTDTATVVAAIEEQLSN